MGKDDKDKKDNKDHKTVDDKINKNEVMNHVMNDKS